MNYYYHLEEPEQCVKRMQTECEYIVILKLNKKKKKNSFYLFFFLSSPHHWVLRWTRTGSLLHCRTVNKHKHCDHWRNSKHAVYFSYNFFLTQLMPRDRASSAAASAHQHTRVHRHINKVRQEFLHAQESHWNEWLRITYAHNFQRVSLQQGQYPYTLYQNQSTRWSVRQSRAAMKTKTTSQRTQLTRLVGGSGVRAMQLPTFDGIRQPNFSLVLLTTSVCSGCECVLRVPCCLIYPVCVRLSTV